MFLYLALDARAHAVEIRFTQPIGRCLHAAGDTIGDLTHAVAADGDFRRSSRTAEFSAIAALTELLGARLQGVGEFVLRCPCARSAMPPVSPLDEVPKLEPLVLPPAA